MNLRNLSGWAADRNLFGVTAASALAMSVLVVGPWMLDSPPTQRFLVWNLALAWVPFLAAMGVELCEQRRWRIAVLASGAVWIFFLPNAPYLISDLTHLRHNSATPWLDLTRLVAFGWAGCLLAVASLRIVHQVVVRRAGAVVGWLVVASAAICSGVGVVLGRFSRLNSWEVVTEPSTVLAESLQLAGSRQAVAVGAFFALLVAILYVTITPQLHSAPRRP